MKKILLSLSLLLVLALGSVVVFADETPQIKSSVQILSEVTGLTEDAIISAVKDGKSISSQAQERDVFEKFVEAVKANRILRIQQLANDGKLTQERADVMINFMNNYQCEGAQEHTMRIELNQGEPFGLGAGNQGKVPGFSTAKELVEIGNGQGMRRGLSAEEGTGGRAMMRSADQFQGKGNGIGGLGMGAAAMPAE